MASVASVASTDKAPDSLKVSEEFAKFLEEKRPGWGKADTSHEYEYVIDRFIQIIGDLPVLTAMTNDNYAKFIQTIRKLPINLNTNPKLKGKSIDEIIAMDLPAMSDRTAQKYHTRCNAFISWLKKFRYKNLHIHPTFVKAKEKVSAKKKRQRKPFNDEQLSIIFESEKSLSYLAKQRQPHKVWVPILALFLGNRLNEACQLKLSDVHDEANIPYITITDEETDQGVKADASMRDVPICSQLIQMGFLEYVRYLRTLPERKTHGQLFPDLKPRPDDQSNYGHQYSQFFGRFMDKLGITGKQYVFHSFRHTANMTLRRSGQDHVWIDIYLGWSKDDDESSEGVVSYMTDVKVDDLVQVAEAVTYPKLNLAQYAELCRATYARKTYI